MQLVSVYESSQVGEGRRRAAQMCRDQGFTPENLARVELIVTEGANNLLKHAGGGEIILSFEEYYAGVGLRILFLDNGPGMSKISQSMRDGYSRIGSSGTGLGAMQRLSSHFDIYSFPGQGTVILSVVSSKPWINSTMHLQRSAFNVEGICLPLEEENVGGDDWTVDHFQDRTLLLVVDGLGHGVFASDAAKEAVRCFKNACGKNLEQGPVGILRRLHESLKGFRGVAGAVAEIVPHRKTVRYAGAGNISGKIVSGKEKEDAEESEEIQNMVSANGTLGLEVPRFMEFTYVLPESGLLIMHSDGISSRWRLGDYPGLRTRHPALIAGVLYRDSARLHDDAVVVVSGWEGKTTS